MIFNMRAKEVLGVIECDSTKLVGSYDSVLKINEIGGVCVQGENPTPSKPQEIKNSVVSGVRTHENQFFKGTLDTKSFIYLVPIKKGETFVISFDYSGEGNKSRYGLYIFDEIGGYGTSDIGGSHFLQSSSLQYATSTRNVLTITAEHDGYLYFRQVTPSNYVSISNFQVEKDIATPYEPYRESSMTLSQPVELYGVGDVQDVITPKQIVRKFAKVVLDGSSDENWTKESGFEYVFRHRHEISNVISYSENQLCTHLLHANSYNESTAKEGYFAISSTSIIVNISGITTSPDLRSFLAENPMTFIFDLSEEVIEELPLADQLALNSLQTFNGVTYVEFDSEVQPSLNSDYATSPVGAIALSVHAYNEIEKRYITYNDDGSMSTGKIISNDHIKAKNFQAEQMLFAEGVQTWFDIICEGNVKADKNLESKEYVVGKNIQAEQMVFAQAVEASMNLISKGNITADQTIEAKGDLKGKDLYVTNISVNGGAPQPIEWVWDSALARWVLCSTEPQE